MAQTDQATVDTEEETLLEEVVVTGSRIARTNAESPVPLQVFSSEDLEVSGTTDLAEAVLQLPGVSPSVSPQSSNFLIQTSGLSTISLRRLGDDRTLVLINGKRAVSNSGNADRVSLSTLPTGFVKRTEVTTGGASAIYGSDAIAGVANFILQDNFHGSQIDARYSMPLASGGEELRLNGLFGTNFADERGYVLIGIDYRDEEIIRADNTRPLSVAAVEFDDPSFGSNDLFAAEWLYPGCLAEPVGNDKHCLLPSHSTGPGGVFEGDAWWDSVDQRWYNDKSLHPDGRPFYRTSTSTYQDYFADHDGWDFRTGRTLSGSRKLMNIALHSTWEFSPETQGSFTAMYSDVESLTVNGYETLDWSDAYGASLEHTVGSMSSSHPFIPPEVEETRSGSVSFNRRVVELGEQSRHNDRTTTRLIAELSGELNENFTWEAYATYGHFKQVQDNPNELNFLHASYALDIEEDGSGGYQCKDADARTDGCVPLNVFGEGTITPEAANYIRYNGHASQSRDQYTAGAYVSGDLFDLPSGPVKAVFGAEYRKEEQSTHGDPESDLIGGVDGDPATDDINITSLAVFPSLTADYRVYEAFTEFDFPVTDSLNLMLAARYADYDTVGGIFSYNLGALWRATNTLQLRAQYSLSQRAPSITEFFSPPRQDADGLEDVCNGLMYDQTTGQFITSEIGFPSGTGGQNADMALVTANCTADVPLNQGMHAWLADPDNAGEEFSGSTSVNGPNAGAQILDGKRLLEEETADTYTFGFAWQPSPDFTLITDYYRIDIRDNIDSVSTQNTVDLCYSAPDFPNNKFCDVITRSPGDGDVLEVINYQANLDRVLVEGIDVSMLYNFEFGFMPGVFDIDFRYTHYLTDETTFIGIEDTKVTTISLGEIEEGEDEWRLRFGYDYGGFRVVWTTTYMSGGIDDINADKHPDDDRYFKVGGVYYHRLYGSYTWGEDGMYRIYGGVNNVGDSFGPLMASGLDHGSSMNIVSDLNDVVGREYYLGVRFRF